MNGLNISFLKRIFLGVSIILTLIYRPRRYSLEIAKTESTDEEQEKYRQSGGTVPD